MFTCSPEADPIHLSKRYVAKAFEISFNRYDFSLLKYELATNGHEQPRIMRIGNSRVIYTEK